MKRVLASASALFLVSTVLLAAPSKRVAAPAPDFWYVVPGEVSAAVTNTGTSKLVRGIVVPTSVRPTVQTTPAGSVISWRRPDGTRQSFVVEGVSSFTFEPGPLAGTTYVPFKRSKLLEYDPRSCCSCASWANMVESVELLACVPGCVGCGCEGCICSPTFPCPSSPGDAMTLVSHSDPATTMTIGQASVRFRGGQLTADMASIGETVINNPDAIILPGPVETRSAVRGDAALFAWSSPSASVILEQPRFMPSPSFEDGTIEFNARPDEAPMIAAKYLAIAPVMDRCSACGTHPNSQADLEIYDCVPGFSVCYRCVSWECFTP